MPCNVDMSKGYEKLAAMHKKGDKPKGSFKLKSKGKK